MSLACERAKADPEPIPADPETMAAVENVAVDRAETATAAKAPPAPKDPVRFIDVTVEHSLETTVVKATDGEVGPKLTQVAKRVLVWWINPRRELLKGDRLEIVYEPRDGEEPIVHALWFRSGKLGKQKVAVRVQLDGQGFARFYEPDGAEVERRLVNGPILDYEQVTSLLGDGRGHRGVDFKTPIGTPIRSPFNGRVVRRNWARRRNGNCVEIVDSRSGLHAYFLHLDSISRQVRPGRRVKKGQIIAQSGNTGRSFAPHLHYQLERRGRAVDPFRVHRSVKRHAAPEQVEKVQAALQRFAAYRTGAT